MMERAGMFASTGREMQLLAGGLLADLCFLDDRDADYRRASEDLHRYGKLGVPGAVSGDVRRCQVPG
jgi:hypothetical protein